MPAHGPVVEADPVAGVALAAAVATLTAAIAAKQDAVTAGTDAEIAAAKAELQAAVDALQAQVTALGAAGATDAELASAVASLSVADAALDSRLDSLEGLIAGPIAPRFKARLQAGQDEPALTTVLNMVWCGDSTQADGTALPTVAHPTSVSAARLVANQLAAEHPAWTVVYHVGAATGFGWTPSSVPTTIQNGTGGCVLNVYNAGVPGSSVDYFLGEQRMKALFAALKPAVVVPSWGYNHGNEIDRYGDDYMAFIESVLLYSPRTELAMIMQGPNIVVPVNTKQDERAAEVHRIAVRKGAPVINVLKAFRRLGPASLINSTDTLHPNADGMAVIAALFMGGLRQATDVVPNSRSVSGFTRRQPSRIPNGHLRDFNTTTLKLGGGWVKNALELSRDEDHFMSPSQWDLKVKGIGELSIQFFDVAAEQGQQVTITQWMYVPSGQAENATIGRISAQYSGGGVKTSLAAIQARDGWHPRTLRLDVGNGAHNITYKALCGSADPNSEMTLGPVTLAVGDEPCGIVMPDVVPDFFLGWTAENQLTTTRVNSSDTIHRVFIESNLFASWSNTARGDQNFGGGGAGFDLRVSRVAGVGAPYLKVDGQGSAAVALLWVTGGVVGPHASIITANYAATIGDEFLPVDTSAGGANGEVDIALPSSSVVIPGKRFVIKDAGGAAGTNNVLFHCTGRLIDGVAGAYRINTNGGAVEVEFDGTNYRIRSSHAGVDGPAASGSRRTLGTGALQAMAGNDPRIGYTEDTHANRLAAAAPSAASKGQEWKETDTGVIYKDNGAIWVPSSAGRVLKLADEIVNNNSVLQDDDELKFPIEVNEMWFVEAYLLVVAASTNADWKFTFNGPTGCLGQWHSYAAGGWLPQVVGSSPGAVKALGSALSFGAAAVVHTFTFAGWFTADATHPGTIVFQWAQSVATVEDNRVMAGSFLRLQRLK